MIDVRHLECGAIAFRVRCPLDEARSDVGVVLDSKTVVYDDGRVIRDDDGTGVRGDVIVCQACGRIVTTVVRADEVVAVTVEA